MSNRVQRLLSSPVLLLLASAVASSLAAAQSWSSSDGVSRDVPGTGEAVLLQGPEAERRFTLARLDEVSWSEWEELSDLLTDIHRRTGVPALAAAFVRDGKIVAHATVGVQEFGSTTPVTDADAFHLGSVTKSFTAIVVGKLVEDGLLAWSTTVGDALDDVEMQAAYRDVTVEQLLQHRGGLHAFTDGPPPGMPELEPPGTSPGTSSGTPTQQRAAFSAAVLKLPPAVPPGEAMLYSNAGYALAGHIAERAAGVSWEELVTRTVFEPLDMKGAGFGVPAHPAGHAGNGPEFHPVPLDAYPRMERIAPAGNVHCSVSDLARYALAQLDGLGGRDGILRSETVKRLHTAEPDAAGMGYAGGWMLGREPSGEPVHWHGGTIGASYTDVHLYPETGCAAIVLTTVARGIGEAIAGQVTRAMLERYRPSQPGPVPGFVSAGGAAAGTAITKVEVAAGDDARFWRTIVSLSEAINNEDREAFAASFSAAYPAEDRDSVFDFMARNVLPARGGIHAFHTAGAPFRIDGSERTLRNVTFHLENGFPGSLGFALDEEGKVIELSLFVKGDLCPNGTDRRCPLIVRKLDEGS